MVLSLETPPAGTVFEPSDAAFRQALRLYDEETEENAYLADLIAEATGAVEDFTRRRLMTQTVRLHLDGFGCGAIQLPVDPIQSVSAVKYINGQGAEQTLAPSRYRLVRSESPTLLRPAYGTTWPVARQDQDVVSIDMVVGYGATGADVPAKLREAVKFYAAARNLNRDGAGDDADEKTMRERFHSMLMPWVVWV